MSPPLLDLEGESSCNRSVLGSSVSLDLTERNYLGLSDCSSVDSSAVSTVLEGNKSSLNLKATELRLGLPGSQSPERDSEMNLLSRGKLDEKPLFPLLPSKDGICSSSQKAVVSGNKRGFSDTVDEYSGVKGKGAAINAVLPNRSPGTQSSITKEVSTKAHERSHPTNGTSHNNVSGATNNSSAPAAKAQVVGWPPIRSFRKNTLATTSKNNDEVDGKPGPGALFVKVSMDGAPYLRKVDLRTYSTYQELSSALEKMFSCFTIGQCGSQGGAGRELSESKLRDLLHGSEYVLTYEDKDGDWMLVGDVPWEMFIDSCKRLKIMKGSDAIGLGLIGWQKVFSLVKPLSVWSATKFF